MSTLTLLYQITIAISGASACFQVAPPAAASGGPSLFPIAALGAAVVLPHASALSIDYARAVEKAEQPTADPHLQKSLDEAKAEPVVGHSLKHGYKAHAVGGDDEAGLPGIAGAPPPQSGIAQILPGEAPLRLHGLPGWCRGTEVEPRPASMRARGFARLARRNFYEEEVMAQPADPLEWACYHPWSAWFLYAILIWVVGTMVAFMLASFCYRSRDPKYDEQSHANPEETFQSGHFGCFSDRHTCLMAFICPVMRWADTVQMAGVLSFWFAFWVLSTCYLPSLAFFVIWGLFPLVPLVMARQQLRDKLGLPAGNETWVSDCCFAFFCSCCLIAQEARVVNEAYAIGHTSMPISGGRVG
mmetsp:Transcript_115407/g.337469  ORF Transcript_115407/g.337469 Transcript_115407/m.337469 type:complete len:358 (+) Transcript_115407:2-1075(+)